MEWALRPLTELVLAPLPKDAKFADGYFEGGLRSAVLSLSQPRTRLPTRSASRGAGNGDFARVLPTPFDPYTVLSVRVVEHLRIQLLNGMGPTQPNAHLMLCLMLIDGIVLQDVEQLWHVEHPFQRLTKSQVAAVYSRPYCRAQIRRPLCGPTLLMLALKRPELQGSWMMSCRHVQRWLQTQLSHLLWPSDTAQAMQCLAAMISRWQRFTLPPFLLTATSPALTTPTASAGSLMRLLERAPTPDLSALRFSPPIGRSRRKKLIQAKTALTRVIDALNLVHRNQDASGGEDEKRIAELATAITALNCEQHGPALMLKNWIIAECALWPRNGPRDRAAPPESTRKSSNRASGPKGKTNFELQRLLLRASKAEDLRSSMALAKSSVVELGEHLAQVVHVLVAHLGRVLRKVFFPHLPLVVVRDVFVPDRLDVGIIEEQAA